LRCCTWNAGGKRPAARTTSGTMWVTSMVVRAHYRCASSQDRRSRCSLAPCEGSVRTLASGSDVRALISHFFYTENSAPSNTSPLLLSRPAHKGLFSASSQ
jgi:hypothetical protein